ncbi:tetratricopeptide repeat protein [Phytohabitans sp. LJ34]|uniref:tetratricopeptide repeat protein n=1 Tax=Phytohabitans sp. LJ34 TaxID=3452217 RepID=UPI003F894F57
MIAPMVVGGLLAGIVAVLSLTELPSWLNWCPPWLAVLLVAGLGGSATEGLQRWAEHQRAVADSERAAVDLLRGYFGRHKKFPRFGERRTGALALHVHPAISLPPVPEGIGAAHRPTLLSRTHQAGKGVLDPDLPAFVPREKQEEVEAWMRDARIDGGFLILVGDSCVGKTRLLYEAARQHLADFAVLAPVLGDGGLVDVVAQATFPLPNLVVWLDELQRFLPGPYLTAGSTAITAATIRRLLDAPAPVVIVGTLWPEHALHLRASATDAPTGEALPRNSDAADILTHPRVHEIRLGSFSEAERAAAARLAAHDPRLAAALKDHHYNVTEALAGVREIIRRYGRATDAQLAILHAAADARRVGIQAPLTETLLVDAARGYLTNIESSDDWFRPAMDELTSHKRQQDRATAPLVPVASPDMRKALGYTVTDYLLQQLTRERRSQPIPALTWQAFTGCTHSDGDLQRLAESAYRRLLYEYAERTYRIIVGRTTEFTSDNIVDAWDIAFAARQLAALLIAQGRAVEAVDVIEAVHTRKYCFSPQVVIWLAELLTEEGRTDEAIDFLRGQTKELKRLLRKRDNIGTGNFHVMAYQMDELLDHLLAEHGREDELRARYESGIRTAAPELGRLLARAGQLDDAISVLLDGVKTGAWTAEQRLAEILAEHGRIEQLRDRANAGDEHAADQLVHLLIARGHTDEATEVLRHHANAYHGRAKQLVRLLVAQGRTNEAIEVLEDRIADGDWYDAERLVELLVNQGHIDETIDVLRPHADAGERHMPSLLAQVLAAQDRLDEAIEILRTHADAGNWDAKTRLAELLAAHGRTDALHTLADAGEEYAAARLSQLLAGQGRIDEAVAILRSSATAGGWSVDQPLADLLANNGLPDGSIDYLRTRSDAGDFHAARGLVSLLAKHGCVDKLSLEVVAGTPTAATRLIDLLVEQGDTARAWQIRRYGLNVDGSPRTSTHSGG